MVVSWDPTVWKNYVLCVVVVMGFGGYAIKNDKVPLYSARYRYIAM